MTARGMLAVLALSALFPAMSTAQGHPAPAPAVLVDLIRHHHRNDWWRITTDSARYEARVREIDTAGLAGITTARNAPPAPSRFGWDSIVRIDLKKSHETRGHITWMLLGTSAGFIPLANGHANSNQPGYYLLAGAAAGYYLGGRRGAADVHERPVYVAPIPAPAPVIPVVAALDSASMDTAGAAPAGALPVTPARESAGSRVPASMGAATPAITSACRRISPGNLLKIDGDFGTFCGYASTIGPEGLGGLRVETTRTSVQSPGSVGWERVNGIDVYGNNAGRGALGGALAFGVVAGLIGIPIGQVLAGNGNDGGAGAWGITLACAGVGAGFGLVVGTLGGSLSSGWHPVYRRE